MFLDFLKDSADEICDFAAPIVGAANPFAGILVKLVGSAFDKVDEAADDDSKRTELMLKFAAYLMRTGAAITDAAADGEFTEEEFAKIKKALASLNL